MKLFGSKHGKYEGRHTSPRRRKRRSTKSLLPLCLVLILGVCLTVGGTLAFMQQKTETVTNTFKAGDITYTLNLEANATNIEMPSELTSQSSTSLSATFTPDKAPTKTGYTFGGWYYDTACTDAYPADQISGDSIVVKYGDEHDQDKAANKVEITLYAKWTPNTYEVAYNGNGTDVVEMENSTHTYDVESALSQNTYERTGYTFTGWNTKPDGTGDAYADVATVKNLVTEDDGEITLYAQWKPIVYTVKYHENGGTGTTADSEHTYDVAKALNENGFTRVGHDFLGWSTDANATTATYTDKQSVMNLASENEAVVNLYAIWKSNIYVVSFDVNTTDNVTKPADQQVIYGEAYGTLPTVTRDKYKFTGWTLTKNGDDYVTKDTIVSTIGNHTLYAKWVGSHEYTITYYANAGNASFTGGKQQVTDTKVQDASYKIKTPTELGVSRNGYVWTQWNTKPDGTGTSYLGEAVYSSNSDLTLYAIWATKTNVTFGEPDFVNMDDPSKTSGADAYNFTIKCKTRGGADGIAIPIYNLIPGESYRLTFSVTFNNFQFYRDDDGDYGNTGSTNGSYIFGTNIIDQYVGYDTKLSIISQDNKKTTSKYENMQWSTTNSGHFDVYLDFVPDASTMYWFWETTDIKDGQEMSYVFNNFNIHNRGPVGARVEFEDLTVTYETAPYIDQTYYTWPNATNGVVRHKNYFHTESFGSNYLNYRVFGYNGHERMTIPITGLTVGQWYELSFTQDLSGAVPYNTSSSVNTSQLFGCAVSDMKTTADGFGNAGCVDTMDGYMDLRRGVFGNTHSTSIKFLATNSTMYWQWTLGDLQDRRWSDVSLTNVSLRTTTAPQTLEEAVEKNQEIAFIYSDIDDTNMDIWYPVDEQYPVAGDSYELAFEPSEGYTMAEAITVTIDDVTYVVYTNGQTEDGAIAPVYDPEANVLSIPAELLTTETTYVSVTASAVPVEIIITTEQTETTETESDETEATETETVAEEATITVAMNLTNMTAQGDTTLQVGEDYTIVLVPDDGYQLPEIIRVEIDDTLYEVYTDGLEHRELPEGETELPPMPTFDPATGTLTIPAILLGETTQNVTITVSAVEIVANETEASEVATEEETEESTDESELATVSSGDAALPPDNKEEGAGDGEAPADPDGGEDGTDSDGADSTTETTESSSEEVAE